jgi:MoxR-like ATPase
MTNEEKKYHYDGTCQPSVTGDTDAIGRKYFPYFPGDDLKEAVNLAIALDRPLLLEGSPGCGKTQLAAAIAYEFTKKFLKDKTDENGKQAWYPYHIWNVKSVGRARDGLYTFDAVGRLRDAQLVGMDSDKLKSLLNDTDKIVDGTEAKIVDGTEAPEGEFDRLKRRLRNVEEYRKFGPLGNALSQTIGDRPIVLIDEIDKADSDFPNDLLMELDQLRFEIPETGEHYPKGDYQPKPIIIITSNQERPLPEPFLRRCLYFFVDFPDKIRLNEVICGRFGTMDDERLEFVDLVIQHFLKVREVLQEEPGTKLPGTSEILDFLTALKSESTKDAIAALEDLANRSALLGIVLKTQRDQELYRDIDWGEDD